ncbi:protein translocase subunit SecD [Shewanella fidelis]|uniref:Protein translocase subunit SecD n=1 Tax=Shewanella fidelis TaxID=173509 RepID=A0AAW8NM25_9GAMM|nr:protein translocase subunit SecD [Shewanella fidelis]MDR8522894.1 protein translocase subunit SecD [Shewanella fidelis]MDW4811780.1 protein translocase subunit SecD [Shewanella fidelis]MDW4815901.1 protein translocase subunit SecD [Shewanella fidelis]MDW4819991.1 protein translocase subunit SecD [Shewanella fidelis]MDW4824035.1 protein translocase subunit SecD [Shewanella fidelis]
MREQKQTTILNHYSAWKYVLLVVTITVMLFSALPTFFGEDAAVQIAPEAELNVNPLELHQLLISHGIDLKRIDQSNGQTTVILADNAQQTQLKTLLSQQVKDPSKLTLTLAPAAPNWLLSLGFNPIKLGLDLRGGVQFLLDVEIEPVYKLHNNAFIEAVRQFVRQDALFGVNVKQQVDGGVQIQTAELTQRAAIREFINKQYPNWQISNAGDKSLQAALSEAEKLNIRDLTVKQNLQIMRSRIEQLGITEAVVQRQGEHRIRIELPGVQDPAAAKSVIGATASLAFYQVKQAGSVNAQTLKDEHGQAVYVARRPVLGGEHIVDARATLGEMGLPEVVIHLDREGGSMMSDFSRDNIGKPMATSYSEYSRDENGQIRQSTEVISVATIQSQLGDRFSITGAGNYAQAQELALLLRAGSMTAPVTIVEERTIGPSLGEENITNGFSALALGMGVTLLFMGLWYRRLGWVANVALMANMILIFGLMALIPGAVLTLPGIAGLVLTVGMAVDTNVLIFERIKDKLKEGRSFAHAIDRGFDSAFSTIVDANFTTMITAVVLYAIGNGPIQGFALTLGLGLLTSMFTGIFASRALINWAYGRNFSRNVKV